MVLLGGLEIVAAGYVLNELNKNDKKAAGRRNSDGRRKKHRHHHHNSHSRPNPNRPSTTQGLAPPPYGPVRPNSAPPPSQTWPMQQPQQSQAAGYYGNHPLAKPPPPMQGMIQHNPTMYYDTKTGKWQSGMFPPEMSQNPHRPRASSNLARTNSSSSSSSADSDLAYGERPPPIPQRPRSYERVRPPPYGEHDWYGEQRYAQLQPSINRGDRATTMPPPQGYGQSSGVPEIRSGVFELDAETPGRFRHCIEKG